MAIKPIAVLLVVLAFASVRFAEAQQAPDRVSIVVRFS
jgi:hypothetical protein